MSQVASRGGVALVGAPRSVPRGFDAFRVERRGSWTIVCTSLSRDVERSHFNKFDSSFIGTLFRIFVEVDPC